MSYILNRSNIPTSPRRKKHYWSQLETDMLIQAVKKYEKSWAIILKNVPLFRQNNRTQVDLKDKYRNLFKNINIDGCGEEKEEYIIYSKIGCSFCKNAKELFDSKNINYKEIKVNEDNISEIYKNIDTKTNNYRSFPIIFHNSKFIGGYADLKNIDL